MSTIKAWHICISGFRQHEGQPTGMHQLWAALGVLRAPQTCVVLREWDADWEELADLICLTAGPHPPRVFVYAYSWGAGYGFPKLARHLAKRDIRIQAAVLSDPVFRSRLLCGRWLAFAPWPRIRIPKNVRHVHWFRQHEDWPRAHSLVAESPKTVIHAPLPTKRKHAQMDEAPMFHALAQTVAGVSFEPVSHRV